MRRRIGNDLLLGNTSASGENKGGIQNQIVTRGFRIGQN